MIWNVSNGVLLQILKHGDAPLIDLAFSPNGQSIAAATREAVFIWRVESGLLAHELAGYQDCIDQLAFDPTGQIVSSAGRALRFWRIDDSLPLQAITLPAARVHSLAFDPSGRTIATAFDHHVDRWRIQDGALLGTHSGSYLETDRVNWAINLTPSAAELWSLCDDEVRPIAAGRLTEAYSIALAPAEDVLAAAVEDTIHVRRIYDGSPLCKVVCQDSINAIALTPDGATLAAATGSQVQIWYLANADQTCVLDHQGAESLVFSPDGALLATVQGLAVCVWHMQDRRRLLTLLGHTDRIRAVAFSPDCRMLATGSYDGTVRLWRLYTSTRTNPPPQPSASQATT
jgi:WD40 repeat protein